jgi:DnaJ-class molecular chaperone
VVESGNAESIKEGSMDDNKEENNEEECVSCFGTGKRYVDIGDNNDVEVICDDCRGTGKDR